MPYYYPFGETVKRLVQEDRTPKKVFVLGVYASAVHARWSVGSDVKCAALAVASEPRIFWDGNPVEAAEIIGRIKIPKELGTLKPAGDAWLCDLLPETRLNDNQQKVIDGIYEKYRKEYGLNEVTIPKRPSVFCDDERCKEILAEIEESKAELLILLGDIPIQQFLNKVASVKYNSLQEFQDIYGYGNPTEANIGCTKLKVLPLAHPRQIGGLGFHSKWWKKVHQGWEDSLK